MSETKPRELDLIQAADVLKQYAQPNGMIDNGNLFFAATEYQEAYDLLQAEHNIAVIRIHQLLEQNHKLMEENEALKSDHKALKAMGEFYGDKENYDKVNGILTYNSTDAEECYTKDGFKLKGGKLARQFLAKLEKVLEVNNVSKD